MSVTDISMVHMAYTVYNETDMEYIVYNGTDFVTFDSGAGHRAVWVGPNQSAGPRAEASLSLLCL